MSHVVECIASGCPNKIPVGTKLLVTPAENGRVNVLRFIKRNGADISLEKLKSVSLPITGNIWKWSEPKLLQSPGFKKAEIKVGDKVVNLHKSDFNGLTYMKAYKVIATCRSKNNSDGLGKHCTGARQFIVLDDWGNRRMCSLDNKFYSNWEKVNV